MERKVIPKEIKEDVEINIGKRKDLFMCLQYKKNEYLTEILRDNEWVSGVMYDSKGRLSKMSYYNQFGFLEEYYFENNMLNHMWRYCKNDEGNDLRQEVVAYTNGFVDEANSCYVETKVINPTKDNITFEISFKSGYQFVEGELFYGKKIHTSEQAKKLSKINLFSNPMTITLPREMVIFQDSVLELGVLIRRSVNSKIRGFVTNMPNKKNKTFAHFFIIKQIVK
jgi:hypothetical protein